MPHNISVTVFDPRQAAVDYALSFIGQPYRWGAEEGGGDDPVLGFDCSGFTGEIMKSVGKQGLQERLNSKQQYQRFIGSLVTDPIAGCLIFFSKVPQGEIIHVEMCIDRFQRIGASGGDSTTNTLVEAAVQNAFVKLRPIYSRPNIVGIVDPFK